MQSESKVHQVYHSLIVMPKLLGLNCHDNCLKGYAEMLF